MVQRGLDIAVRYRKGHVGCRLMGNCGLMSLTASLGGGIKEASNFLLSPPAGLTYLMPGQKMATGEALGGRTPSSL